ncbi:MAG: MoxR family ATPase [Opitutales bacterium]|nr:MoxR family ATPase [Opitutales bacterium]
MKRLKTRMGETIRGKDAVIDQVLTALLAGGHVLIEDLPGLGKTTLAYSLARALDCPFQRIQFTSDLLPADILGVSIYDESQKQFVFRPGPVFSHILLADEINRSTPKTQSALLEAMDRGKVSIDGETRPLGQPFMVFATQNPVDFEGTFPLPDSQMDRFLMRLQIGYADYADELQILRDGRTAYDAIEAQPLFSASEVLEWQSWVPQVFIEESVLKHLLDLVTATRHESEFRAGISTRGSLALKTAAQAHALLRGRDFVIPDDIQAVFLPVCTHRLNLRHPGSDLLEERNAIAAKLREIGG